MQDDESKNQDRRPGGGGNGFNWKGLILLSVAMGLFGLAIWSKSLSDSSKNLTYAEFKKLVGEGRIHVDAKAQPPMLLSLVQKDGSAKQYLRGYYEVENPGEEPGGKYRAFVAPVILDYVGDELKALLAAKSLEISELTTDSDGIGMMLMSFYLPVFFLLILLYFLFRHQIRAAGKGAMSFGKSKAKLMTMDKNKVTFKDVAGVDEAKEEVWEIVEYLRDPKKFQRLGGRIPKGVLMVGSPGTGKTLLARAIAGEADVPFFSISGSDFVEMFVGVGASRVRDMFEQGKKNAPCLIFIDEIDAVGRHRGHGLGGGHDEREQTLNALLVEMDGFDTQEGVIIIAATNRPDVLDPALLRPGRFDREITVGLPDVNGREEILRVHAKKVKLAEGVELGLIARGTPGYSGAELANVINEAALLAARKGLKAITLAELEEARDKVRWGKERRSLAISEKDKEKTAYHEAGHAILLVLLENTDPLHKVTIIPRGPSLGSTMWLPEQDKYTQRKSELLDQLVVIMGGRVAEEVVFGDVASGASGDIKQATNIARKMVCEWGMSEELGMVEYGDHQEHVFLGRDMGSPRNYSEATAQKIDAEVKQLIDTAYDRATELIKTHREKLDAIAKGLLEYETLDAKHIHEIMEHGEIQNPPSSPTPPDLPYEAPRKRPVEKEKESEGGLPGLPAPA
jgi:cell division protease FtsH